MKIKRLLLIASAMTAVSAATLSLRAQPAEIMDQHQTSQPKPNPDIHRDMTSIRDNMEKATTLIGMEATDSHGQKIGRVADFAIDLQNGRIAEVLIDTGTVVGGVQLTEPQRNFETERIMNSGGTARVEPKVTAAPPANFVYDASAKSLRVYADAETVKAAPTFLMSQWKDAMSPHEVAAVYQRYGATPPSFADLERATTIIGQPVKNEQGKRLGHARDLALDMASGRIVDVMLASSGGFLGMHTEWSAIAPQAFTYDPAHDVLTLKTTPQALRDAPHFNYAEWRDAVTEPAEIGMASPALPPPEPMTPNNSIAPQSAVNSIPQAAVSTTTDDAITASVQEKIFATDGLSMNARNVQVQTTEGQVTLRGTVETAKEKNTVGDIAASVVSPANVNNELQVRSSALTITEPY